MEKKKSIPLGNLQLAWDGNWREANCKFFRCSFFFLIYFFFFNYLLANKDTILWTKFRWEALDHPSPQVFCPAKEVVLKTRYTTKQKIRPVMFFWARIRYFYWTRIWTVIKIAPSGFNIYENCYKFILLSLWTPLFKKIKTTCTETADFTKTWG